MSVVTVLIVFLAVYILSTLLLGNIHGNYMEGILVASLLMIITIASLTFYDYANKKHQKAETSKIGTVEFTKKDPAPSEAPANPQ